MADVFAVTTSGDLYFYPGTSAGPLLAGQKIASGWGDTVVIVLPGAQRAGEFPVLWRRTPDGRLLAYRTTAAIDGTVSIVYQGTVGRNWGAISAMSAAGDVNGDGFGDVHGRTADGDLWLNFGAAGGGISSQLKVGARWSAINAIFGGFDVTGDGVNDVIARHGPTATMRLYPATPSGVLTGSGPVIGSGWSYLNPPTSLSAPASGNRLRGRHTNGNLYSYAISAPGVISPGSVVGVNWKGIRLLW